jgi:DNA polymerase-3 subunit gamma/tau
VHGNDQRPSAQTGERDHDRLASGPLPPLARPDLRRDRRPGSRRRDAAQRRQSERVSHAVLFVGPRGTGKTSLARILAKAVNCTNLQDGDACDACPSCVSIREGTTLDLIEIDAASNRGIDDVRNLRERLPYPPGQLRRKVYILDEAHQITKDAWNALLKSIEEPPDFVIFMFASTEPSLFPPAILSRLQRYDVRV